MHIEQTLKPFALPISMDTRRRRSIKSIESSESLSSLSDENQNDSRIPVRVNQRDDPVSLMKERLKKSGYRFPPQIITQEDNNQDHNHSDSSLSSLSSSSHSSVSLSPPTTTYNHIKRRAEERMKACNDQNAKKKKQEESESDGISPPSSSSSSVDPSEALCMHETVWSNIENKPLSIGGFHASNTSTMLFCDPFIKDQDNDDLSSLSDLESPRRKTTQEALWEQIANCQEPKWSPQHSKIQNDKPSLEEEIFPISALQLNDSLYEKKNDWLFGGNVHRNASKTSNKMKKEESWYVGCEDLSGILEKYVRKDAKILHVGCGQSKLCAQLVCRGYSHVCGLDNIKNIAHQLEREELYQTLQEYLHFYAQENFDYLQPTWLFQKEYFDCIFATNHLDFLASKNTVSLNGVLGEVTRCLKPGGIFFFVTCRHHKETEKMNDTDEIGYVEDDLVQTAQEFDCWWTWESVSNLLKRQLQPITTYRVGVPTKLIDNLNGKVRHEKPFRVFIWRRKETIVQRKLRIIAEHAWERDRQAELDLFEQNRRDKLSKQLEEQRVIHESAMMLQENLLSTLINQNDLYESEITHRQQIRKQILLQMLEEERNEMINEDESSACMRTFEKQMRLYCRDLVVSSINNAVVIVETKTEIAQRANQGVMACVAYCLEHIFAISEWQIEIANARKPSEKGLIQFLKNAIEATSTTVVAPTANTTSIEQHAEHLSNLSQSSPAIKDEASSGQQKKQATVSEQVNGIMEELIRKVEEREDTSRTTEVALNAPVKRLELVKPQKELPVMQVVKEPLASSAIAPVQKTSNSAPEEIVAPLSTTTRLVKESEEKIDITIAAQKQYLAQSISLENVTKSETVESDERRRSIDNESPQIPENCKKANSSDKVFEKSQQEGEIVQEILREIAERVVQLNL